MAELIKQFHNLEGISIGERKKNLYALLRNPSLQSQQDEFITNLQPQTFLEELFKLEALIFLRRTSDLLKILKDGNEIFVSKIIKQNWFFKDAFQSISAENIVNECLPSMSYALRMKVLKKLSIVLSADQVDNLFDALLKRYGLFIAKQFLPRCTTTKIVKILQTHEIELHAGQLEIFFNRDKNLLLVYLDELKKQGKELKMRDRKFLRRVAEKHLQFFFELRDRYKIHTSVGGRTSKKIIDLRKDDILANPKDYVDILKESVVSRKLKDDFKEFYFKIFSNYKRTYGNTDECNRFLNHAPSRLQFSIISDAYKRVYNDDMVNNEKAMDDDKTLARLSAVNSEACAMIANAGYEKTNDSKFLKYMPISKCVSIIMEKINLTSYAYIRLSLFEILIDACEHHKDLKTLEYVMTYFCKMHWNDEIDIITYFIRYVMKKFSYDDFNDVHWKCLVDLQNVEIMIRENVAETCLLYKYMEHLVKQNKPIKEYLDMYVKQFMVCVWLDDDEVTNPDLFKSVLLEIAKEIPLQVLEEDQDHRNRTLISHILKFNKNNPDKAIDLFSFQRFVDLMKAEYIKYYAWVHYENVKTIICTKSRNQIENEILDCYFSSLDDGANPEILRWFIKNDVSIIAKYFDKIIVGLVEQEVDHWYVFKKYSHLDLDKKAIAYLEQQFNSEQTSNKKKKLVKPLLRILSPEKYASFTEKYLPKTDKINLDDDGATDMYYLQCEIEKSFKYVYHKPTVLEALLNYCKGDYLVSSLGSLYSVIFNTPEEQIPSTLGFLSTRALSVSKHALFLSCHILEKRLVLELLKKAGSEDKYDSIKKHLFSTTIKYFSKNPSEDSWSLVKVFINLIDKSNVNSLKNLTDFSIPNNRHMYWRPAWEFLEKNKAFIPEYHVYMGSLLGKADKAIIAQLPIELLEGIIKEYFLGKSELSTSGPITKFTVTFLLCDKRIDTFKLIFKMIAGFKNENFDWFKVDESKSELNKIINDLISQRKEDYCTTQVIHQFFNNWNKLFTPAEAFKEYVMLSVLKMYKDSNDNLKIFSEKICEFLNTMIERYTLYIISNLCQYIKYMVRLLLNVEDRITLIENIMRLNNNTINCVLCLTFIAQLKEEYEVVDHLLEQVKENEDPTVQLLYNLIIGGNRSIF